MNTKEITSIINANINGLTATEGLKSVQSRLEAVEKNAFNIALLSAYSTGVTIPAHFDNKGQEHGEAICEKPFKQVEFVKLVGRSKATLSRWIKAMNLIIDNGYFNDFASGLYPFSYDKIILIFDNEEIFKGWLLADLFTMSVTTLETMVNDCKPKADEEEATEGGVSDNDKEQSDNADIEMATLIYKGKEYRVPKAAFEKWLAKNGDIIE